MVSIVVILYNDGIEVSHTTIQARIYSYSLVHMGLVFLGQIPLIKILATELLFTEKHLSLWTDGDESRMGEFFLKKNTKTKEKYNINRNIDINRITVFPSLRF